MSDGNPLMSVVGTGSLVYDECIVPISAVYFEDGMLVVEGILYGPHREIDGPGVLIGRDGKEILTLPNPAKAEAREGGSTTIIQTIALEVGHGPAKED